MAIERRVPVAGEHQQSNAPMTSTIQVLVLLLAVVAAVAIVAKRLRIPPSIPLVLTGVLLALVPGLPPVELAPEIVLLLVLPPVIYTSAFQMNWREFRFNLRPITLLSVGGVAFTTLAVAAAAHWLMNLAWPVGFVLGAIISPPDAIAPSRLRAEWRSHAEYLSYSKAKRSRTMQRRSSFIALPSLPLASVPSPSVKRPKFLPQSWSARSYGVWASDG